MTTAETVSPISDIQTLSAVLSRDESGKLKLTHLFRYRTPNGIGITSVDHYGPAVTHYEQNELHLIGLYSELRKQVSVFAEQLLAPYRERLVAVPKQTLIDEIFAGPLSMAAAQKLWLQGIGCQINAVYEFEHPLQVKDSEPRVFNACPSTDNLGKYTIRVLDFTPENDVESTDRELIRKVMGCLLFETVPADLLHYYKPWWINGQ